jgi:L-amino acid N-acyltransferase YncA
MTPQITTKSQQCSIRPSRESDADSIWAILEPTIRAGETYPLPQEMSRDDGLSYWFSSGHQVFVAENNGSLLGTYYLKANQKGGGDHVANCGYVVAPWAQGRGIATLMCKHSLLEAKARNFRAMQFNFVISSNKRAVRLWESLGFEIVGHLPKAFSHPSLGFVDALVMYRHLG